VTEFVAFVFRHFFPVIRAKLYRIVTSKPIYKPNKKRAFPVKALFLFHKLEHKMINIHVSISNEAEANATQYHY
jgi:hypothetical protein